MVKAATLSLLFIILLRYVQINSRQLLLNEKSNWLPLLPLYPYPQSSNLSIQSDIIGKMNICYILSNHFFLIAFSIYPTSPIIYYNQPLKLSHDDASALLFLAF